MTSSLFGIGNAQQYIFFKVNINISMFLKRMELLRNIIRGLDLGEQLTAKHIKCYRVEYLSPLALEIL